MIYLRIVGAAKLLGGEYAEIKRMYDQSQFRGTGFDKVIR
jgi:hypothetical protein